MFGHGGPEIERFLPRGIVSRRRIKFRGSGEKFFLVQIADAVPVNNHVQSFLPGPADALVKQLEVLFLSVDVPGRRMHGDSHDIRAPRFNHFEVMFVPLAIALQLVGVAGVQSAKDDGLAVGGHKMITLYIDMAGFRKGSERKQNAGETETKGFSHKVGSGLETEL